MVKMNVINKKLAIACQVDMLYPRVIAEFYKIIPSGVSIPEVSYSMDFSTVRIHS
jgi:hypothetical protein